MSALRDISELLARIEAPGAFATRRVRPRLEGPHDGIAGHAVQRDLALSRLVLAMPDVKAPFPVALSTSHIFSRSTSLRRMCLTSTPRIEVFAAWTAAQ
jgi:hypothetical protein